VIDTVDDFTIPVYASRGREVRARSVAAETLAWLRNLVDLPEPPPLFVVGADDWERVALLR
jgi:hypothetical protein